MPNRATEDEMKTQNFNSQKYFLLKAVNSKLAKLKMKEYTLQKVSNVAYLTVKIMGKQELPSLI